ncbi:MAG TPA: hypothetical protein DCS93_04925 [Microscillaceae bacterium]|nr:hypothetical protein [Microscillaceae bacterium]
MDSMRIKILLLILITSGLATAQVQDSFVITEKKVNFPINRVAPWDFKPKYAFNQAVVFQNRTFDSVLYCRGFRFVKPANLSGSIFQDTTFFSHNIFEQSVNFSGVHFGDSTVFNYNVFNDKANFSQALFSKAFLLYDMEFKGSVSFSGVRFAKGAYFAGVTLHQADFTNAVFLDKIYFDKVHFKKKVHLHNIQLPAEIYMFDVDLKNSFLDFTQAKVPAKPCHLYLKNNQYLHKIKFDYQYFQLDFGERKYFSFREIEQLYVELLKHQKKWGFKKGYQKLLKEYNAFKSNELKAKVDSHVYEPPPVVEEETIVETTQTPAPPKGNNTTKAFVLVIVVLLVLAFVHLRRQERKRKAALYHPVTVPLVTALRPLEPQKPLVPLAVIEQSIRISADLWGDYLLMADQEAKDDTAFWDQYERLLAKVRD